MFLSDTKEILSFSCLSRMQGFDLLFYCSAVSAELVSGPP